MVADPPPDRATALAPRRPDIRAEPLHVMKNRGGIDESRPQKVEAARRFWTEEK